MTSFHEELHPGAAILSEANGGRSRDNVTIPTGQKFPPNTLIVIATGIPYAGGAGPVGYSIYGVDTTAVGAVAVQTAVISRDAELNRYCIAWPASFNNAAIQAAAVEMAKQHVIVRGFELPSPSSMEAGGLAFGGRQSQEIAGSSSDADHDTKPGVVDHSDRHTTHKDDRHTSKR